MIEYVESVRKEVLSEMNIYDIAKLANVSIATVSRVVNNNENVSEKTKEKVLAVIEREGYVPNAFARGLGLGSMKTIGIICPDVSDLYMSRAVATIEEMLKKYEYQMLLMCSGLKQEEKEKSVGLLMSKKVDALIFIGSAYVGDGMASKETAYIKQAAKKVPVFLVNGVLPYDNVYNTYCDDFHATYEATMSLLQNNCKNILFLYSATSYSAMQKMKGYEQALRDYDLPVLADMKIMVKNSMQYVFQLLVVKRDITFDAVLTTEDSLAIGVLKFAKEVKIKVPSELKVIGYNNSYLVDLCEPDLSSIDSRIEELCEHTVENLLEVLENSGPGKKEMGLQGRLARRNSTDF